jgi:hypothetical protein
MKISYTGDTTIYSTSESATSTAVGGVWRSGDKRKVNINDNMDVSSCFVGGVGVSNLVSVQAIGLYIIGFHNRSFGSNTLSVTSVSTGYEYALTNGNPYTISSTNYNIVDYVNFNAYNNNAQEWMTLPNRYNSSTGEYIGSISTVVDRVGEWTQVMLPYPLKITSAVIINSGVSSNNNDTNTNRSLIKEFVLAGSNDGYTWTNL